MGLGSVGFRFGRLFLKGLCDCVCEYSRIFFYFMLWKEKR